MKLLRLLAPALVLLVCARPSHAAVTAGTDTLSLLPPIVTESAPSGGSFTVFDAAGSAPLWHDAAEHPGRCLLMCS